MFEVWRNQIIHTEIAFTVIKNKDVCKMFAFHIPRDFCFIESCSIKKPVNSLLCFFTGKLKCFSADKVPFQSDQEFCFSERH